MRDFLISSSVEVVRAFVVQRDLEGLHVVGELDIISTSYGLPSSLFFLDVGDAFPTRLPYHLLGLARPNVDSGGRWDVRPRILSSPSRLCTARGWEELFKERAGRKLLVESAGYTLLVE